VPGQFPCLPSSNKEPSISVLKLLKDIAICLQPWQFSVWNKNDYNRHLLFNIPANDADYAYYLELAGRAMAGDLPDGTNGATSYYATSMNARRRGRVT